MSKKGVVQSGEKVFLSLPGRLRVVADKEGTLRVFRWSLAEEGSELMKEYRCHEAAVMAVRFAPIQYKPYMLSVGLDFKVFLHNLAEKHSEPVFEFFEESEDVGYCTTAEFLNSSKEALRFVVGTSTGAALLFNSDKGFVEERLTLGSSAIRALSAGPRDTLAVVCQGEDPRVYFDLSSASFAEFGREVHDSKRASLAAFQASPAGEDPLLLTAGEDLKLGLWRVSLDKMTIALVGSFALPHNPAALTWELSGLSATVVCAKKSDADEEPVALCLRYAFDLTPSTWQLKPADIHKP